MPVRKEEGNTEYNLLMNQNRGKAGENMIGNTEKGMHGLSSITGDTASQVES